MYSLLFITSVLILTVHCQRNRLLDELNPSSLQSILPDNANGTRQVQIALKLLNIVDFDYERQEIELKLWLQLGWTDERLRWDPKEFGDITSVRFNSDYIPKPDVKLYNGDMKIDDDVLAVINSDGSILYIPPVDIKAVCPQNQHHPDQITCNLTFGSWSYDCHQIQLKSNQKSANLSDFQPGWRWNLKDATTKVEVNHYSCCPEPYCVMKLTLNFQDKSKSNSWFQWLL